MIGVDIVFEEVAAFCYSCTYRVKLSASSIIQFAEDVAANELLVMVGTRQAPLWQEYADWKGEEAPQFQLLHPHVHESADADGEVNVGLLLQIVDGTSVHNSKVVILHSIRLGYFIQDPPPPGDSCWQRFVGPRNVLTPCQLVIFFSRGIELT
jgi:hypothetical protein